MIFALRNNGKITIPIIEVIIMKILGQCNVQYANSLLAEKSIVLRADRNRGDNPILTLIANDETQDLFLEINGDIKVETMTSDPTRGAKNRIDIYLLKDVLSDFIFLLESFVNQLNIVFDDTPRSSPDPTGMEHPTGIPLGKIKNITWINGICVLNYADNNFSMEIMTKFFIDAEHKGGKKYHIGISGSAKNVSKELKNSNFFRLILPYSQLKRFFYSLKIADKWLM